MAIVSPAESRVEFMAISRNVGLGAKVKLRLDEENKRQLPTPLAWDKIQQTEL
jgi:hypothetical protein